MERETAENPTAIGLIEANRPEHRKRIRRLRPSGPDSLTVNELALLQWLCAGRTNAQIGVARSRSEKTVRNQLTRLYTKLDVVNRAQAVAVYLRGPSAG